MDYSWLLTNCDLSLLTREVIESCHPFTCGMMLSVLSGLNIHENSEHA